MTHAETKAHYRSECGDSRDVAAAISARSGFSLLELTVAFVIGGMAVTMAAALLVSLSWRGDAIEAAGTMMDRNANTDRLLRELTVNLDASGTARLEGNAATVRFRTWCESAFGRPEPCSIRLAFRNEDGAYELVLERMLESGIFRDVEPLVLRRAARSGQFIYLVDASHGGTWSDSWTNNTLPVAIAVVLDTDTVLLPVR